MNKLKLSLVTISVLTAAGCMESSTPNSQTAKESAEVNTPQSSFEMLQENLLVSFVDRQIRTADKEGKTVAVMAQELIDRMNSDGSWEGIDYSTKDQSNWTPEIHLNNMRLLAAAYVDTQDTTYADAAIQALDYWFEVKPSAHWWWEDIGKPKFLGEVTLMLGDLLPMHLRFEAAMLMPDIPGIRESDQVEQTGGNRSDINLGVIYRGLLTHDKDMVAAAVKDMETSIFVSNGEGIQADYSYHQHGAQLYSGAYGEVWFNPTLKVAYWVRDTEWKFSKERIDILTNFYLDGWRWMKRGSRLDYNVLGRSLSRPKKDLPLLITDEQATDKTVAPDSLTEMDMVAALRPERTAEAMLFKAHVAGGRTGTPSGLNGFKHFWRSDYSTKMTDEHFFSIRMNSQRVETNESGNGENLLGYWLGHGSTFLEQRGDEYHNIFPVWNWKLIPGVTAPEYEGSAPLWGKILQPHVSFVGGVSDGNYGVTTMDMDLTTKPEKGADFNTKAKKSWFSFKDEIVALGAGISSTSAENVNTTLNQALLNGKVTVDGVELENGVREISSSSWVHHDGVGYIFPQNGERHLSNQTQTGSWKRIKSASSADEVSKDVFTLRISHGPQPSGADYQYIIAPGMTAEQTEAYQQNPPVEVLRNSDAIQAVRHADLKIAGIVFHQPGGIAISDDLYVEVDTPSVVLVDASGKEPVVSLSTPGQSYAKVNLTLDSKAKDKPVSQLVMTHGKTAEQGNSVTFPFYQGAEKSNQAFLNEIAQAEADAKAEAEAKAKAEAEAQAQAEAEAAEQAKHDAEARAKVEEALANGLTLTVTQDAFVRGGNQADKLGGGTNGYMGIENHFNDPALSYKSVLRFDTNGLSGVKATSAKLRLYLKNVDTRPTDTNGNQDTRLQAFAFNGDWTEKQVTWNGLPSIEGAPASDVLTVSHGDSEKWVELDVTDIINQIGSKRTLDLMLVNIDEKGQGGYMGFSTREKSRPKGQASGPYAPQLIIHGELKEDI